MFVDRETRALRQAANEREWQLAKKSLKRSGAGCLFLGVLIALGLTYVAGYMAEQSESVRKEMLTGPLR